MDLIEILKNTVKPPCFNPELLLTGWDVFFQYEEVKTIGILHLIVYIFSFFINIFVCLTQWQVTIIIILYRKFMAGGFCTSTRRLDGKIAIVTGSNSGIGKETARNLAKRGAKIILACIDVSKADVVADEIRQEFAGDVISMKLDLRSLDSVRSFAEEFKSKFDVLHILVNNAGIMMCPFGLTKDGFESQFGVNHLGHFLLTNLLIPLMKKASEARIVNVSSIFHTTAKMDLDDMLYKKAGYLRGTSYANSKLANILFSRSLSDKFKDENIKVFSLHPGVVQTELGRSWPYGMGIIFKKVSGYLNKKAIEGAQTSIYCAVEAESHPDTYFSDCRVAHCTEDAKDTKLADKLWKLSAKLVKLEQN